MSVRDQDRKLLQIRRKMFDASIATFSQATQQLHPTVEWHARNTAVFAVTTGEGMRLHSGYSAMEDDKGKPLSSSVHTLCEIAYEEGVYLDPLKEEMKRKLDEFSLSPADVANVLEQSLAFREDKKDIADAASKDGHMWFISEAFFSISSVDENGRYTQKKDWCDKKGSGVHDELRSRFSVRDPERPRPVVEDIISFLRSYDTIPTSSS